jgi:hypothetical protein
MLTRGESRPIGGGSKGGEGIRRAASWPSVRVGRWNKFPVATRRVSSPWRAGFQRSRAHGSMGAADLCTYKWMVRGNGQVRS